MSPIPTASLFTDLTIEVRDGSTGASLYKSAKIRISEQTRLMFAVTKNIGPGPSPVQVIAVDGTSGTYTDPDDNAAVRLDARLAGHTGARHHPASALQTPIAKDISHRRALDYVSVPNGDVDLIAQPADAATSMLLVPGEFSAAVGMSYSDAIGDALASVDAQMVTDDRRKVPTQAKFRFLSAAPSQEGGDGPRHLPDAAWPVPRLRLHGRQGHDGRRRPVPARHGRDLQAMTDSAILQGRHVPGAHRWTPARRGSYWIRRSR